MRLRLLIVVPLIFGANVGCGGGSSCSIELIEQSDFYPPITVGCCGASVTRDFPLAHDNAELDIANSKPEGPASPVHAWLTTPDCSRLFDGGYPPAAGPPVPLCTAYLGPVSPGEVSPRRKLPPGTYRLWVQAFSSNLEPQPVFVKIGIWGEQCDRPLL